MSDKKQTAAERSAELWDKEGPIAIRIVEWFELLIKFRRAADAGVPSDLLVEQLKRADPDMLRHDFHWLMNLVQARFVMERDELARLRTLESNRHVPDGKISDVEYDRLAPTAENDKALAAMLGAHPVTLSRYKARRFGKIS